MTLTIDRARASLIQLPKPVKLTLILAVDSLIIPIALWLAFLVRLGVADMIDASEYLWLFAAAWATTFPTLALSGLYRSVLRYMGRDTIAKLFTASTISALLLGLVIYWSQSTQMLPRTLVVNYWFLLFTLIGGSRYIARALLLPEQRSFRLQSILHQIRPAHGKKPIAIYGAGSAGVQLLAALKHERDIWPVAFIDDNRNLHGRVIRGLRVYSRREIGTLLDKTGVTEILLAMPTLSPQERSKLLQFIEPFAVHVRSIPSLNELTTGRRKVRELEEIRVEDILGREVVTAREELLSQRIAGRSVMVTGGGGSIGSELCRQIIMLEPEKLVIFEHSEFNLFTIEAEIRSELHRLGISVHLVAVLGSVLNKEQMLGTINEHRVETIYHAAAYKHVHIIEQNVSAGIRNNVFGTLYAVAAAMEGGVDDFVLVSTDKAVNPTSIMGATKRLAEMILQALSAETGPDLGELAEGDLGNARTRMTIVRFGNVLDSSGSVIPKFRSQIENGGPVTVTDREVTRYFMTMEEAAQLVVQASSMGAGGDVFILDMGEPVRIYDLALKMIRLTGQVPRLPGEDSGQIRIELTGLRPGEKLHEELHTGGVFPTGHPKIYRAQEHQASWNDMLSMLANLREALNANDLSQIHNILLENVEGFTSNSQNHGSAEKELPDDRIIVELGTRRTSN